ncbi:hypothetical protein [Paenibacillus sp. 1P03SA]|uniref:hypothetical protein n=1 Tax=Paenibacillus sp. 1P03SA TaxID=3132294 RepID=UPI0039A05C3A
MNHDVPIWNYSLKGVIKTYKKEGILSENYKKLAPSEKSALVKILSARIETKGGHYWR